MEDLTCWYPVRTMPHSLLQPDDQASDSCMAIFRQCLIQDLTKKRNTTTFHNRGAWGLYRGVFPKITKAITNNDIYFSEISRRKPKSTTDVVQNMNNMGYCLKELPGGNFSIV